MRFINKQTLMAGLIVFIMVFSALGYMLGRTDEQTIVYNGHKFKIKQDGIFTNINGKEARFDYLPEDVQDISVDRQIISLLSSTRMVYSTSNYSDVNSEVIAGMNYELAQMLNEHFNTYLEIGFLQKEQKQINCSRATQYVPVMLIETGQTCIELQGNCIIAKANDERDFLRVKDRLLYGMTGVIQNGK